MSILCAYTLQLLLLFLPSWFKESKLFRDIAVSECARERGRDSGRECAMHSGGGAAAAAAAVVSRGRVRFSNRPAGPKRLHVALVAFFSFSQRSFRTVHHLLLNPVRFSFGRRTGAGLKRPGYVEPRVCILH